MRALAISLAGALGLVGCSTEGDPVPDGTTSLPEVSTGLFQQTPGHPYRTFVLASGSFSRDMALEDDLQLLRARSTDGGWESTEVVMVETGYRYWFGLGAYRRISHRCEGSARFANDTWTLSFADAACGPANGVYLREEALLARARAERCTRYRDCACPLAQGPNGALFAPYCEAAERLLREPPEDPTVCSAHLVRAMVGPLGITPPDACAEP